MTIMLLWERSAVTQQTWVSGVDDGHWRTAFGILGDFMNEKRRRVFGSVLPVSYISCICVRHVRDNERDDSTTDELIAG